MRAIELECEVERPPDGVFGALTDFSMLTKWRTLESLRVAPDGAIQPGSRIYTSVRGPSGRMRFENEVTVVDPERRLYDDRAVDGTFLIESGWRVEPRGAGSRIVWTTRYQGRGMFRLMGPLLGRIVRSGQLKDLAKFKALIEESAP